MVTSTSAAAHMSSTNGTWAGAKRAPKSSGMRSPPTQTAPTASGSAAAVQRLANWPSSRPRRGRGGGDKAPPGGERGGAPRGAAAGGGGGGGGGGAGRA